MFDSSAPGNAVDVLIDRSRQIASMQAQFLTDLLAVAALTPVPEFAPMEIASALTWTRQATTVQLDLAARVHAIPAVHAALAAGSIDLPKARVIIDGLSCLDAGLAARIAADILPMAPSWTTGQLRARLAKLVLLADPAAAERRHLARVKGRRMVLQPEADGCASLLGLDLPADRAVAAAQRLSDMAHAAKRAGDPRSVDQLRADLMLDLILADTPVGTRRGSVELVASLESLSRLADHPGDLAGYGPVAADIARRVAADQHDVTWTYRIHDDVSGDIFHGTTRARPTSAPTPTRSPRPAAAGRLAALFPRRTSRPRAALWRPAPAVCARPRRPRAGNQAPAAEGARLRFPRSALARAIRSRDRTCRAPGCRAPARRSDIDHTVAYEDGGCTEPGNLGVLCRYHHRAKHEGGWRLEQVLPGRFIWRSPLGRVYRINPDPP